MLKKIMAAAFLPVLAFLPPFQAVDAQPTSRQLWAMPREQAAEQSMRDLSAILSPSGVYPRGFEGILFRGGVVGTDLLTRPYGSLYPGVCARDILTLRYAHVGDVNAADRATEPVRAYQVRIRQEFALVRPPTVAMLIASETGNGSQFRPECADIGPSATWFSVSGDDPRLAANGWMLIQNALRAAHAGTLRLDRCETPDVPSSTSCMQLLDSLSDYHLLRGVTVDISGNPQHYYLELGDYYVTIVTGPDAGSIRNDRVTAISVTERSFAVD
jgi:hypothetical protein